jgi:serine/threonine protein kinase
LPDAFAQDAERLARFEREAKTLATLNHSNIAAIYGLEKADGVRALVMELVDGATLADRIAQGPIPVDEVLIIARQIADALEAAHEQGVIHRDLKPANVKVRSDGTVKVLDFGLAKAMEPAGDSHNLSQSPTITSPAMTAVGMILGTAAYMSPEQARGKPVDKRTDIWAFGVVLYEMLTSARAFAGEDVTETIGAVIHKEPAWSELPAATPTGLRRLLRRCLEKDPRRRLRDIGDAAIELALDRHSDVPDPPRTQQRLLPWMVTALSCVLAGVFGLLWLWRSVPEIRTIQFTLGPPPATRFQSNTGIYPGIAVSPDGRFLVLGAVPASGGSSLWLQPLDGLTPRPLPGTEGAVFPFWSPDSKSIAFVAEGKLKRLDIAGGSPLVLCDVPQSLGNVGAGGTWNRDGVILFGTGEGLYRIEASGGAAQRIVQPDGSRQETA